MSGIPVGWKTRQIPLDPVAVAAAGPSARALADRVLAAPSPDLRGVCTADALVLLGETRVLPWADGVVYLGRDPRSPGLLVPTWREPDVPPELLEHALAERFGPLPLAVLVEPGRVRVIRIAEARPVDSGLLRVFRSRVA